MAKVSLEKDKIKFLLVEGVHQKALESLRAAGYTNIEFHKGALDDEQLKESIRDAHFIGLRSRTHLTEDVINAAEKLVAIGCFCIGTNQVDLDAAAKRGIPVFNAPFSNTRSVAELVIGELLLLLRGVPEANAKAHRGVWNKLAAGSLKRAAKSWVSSATVILVRNWAFWLNRWECMFTFMILKTNCRWATPLRYSIFLTC